jgi:thiamine-monophosphate kinase
MIDTSDGLLGDLGHICDESGVGALLYETELPLSPALVQFALKTGRKPLEYVFKESDDYELLITCLPENESIIRGAITELGNTPVNRIGTVTPNKCQIEVMSSDGRSRMAAESGWDHFSQ